MTKLILSVLVTIFISAICFGQQQVVEDENWLKGFNTEADNYPTLAYWATPFSNENLTKAKQRLKIIKESAPENEWEGVYFGFTEIGDEKLIWNEKNGFFTFYFYHALRSINYGTVKNTNEAIIFTTEKPLENQKKRAAPQKYIKVKFGERIYLVPENRLRLFCETAVGVNVENNADYWMDRWTKEGNWEKKTFGLPIVPEKYKHLVRLPIGAKILSAGARKIIPNEQSTAEYNFDDIHYFVTLDAGANKKLKAGMNFYVEALGEWIEITKVSQKTSAGFIKRTFGEDDKTERCWDSEGGTGQITPCREIKAEMKAETKTSEYF